MLESNKKLIECLSDECQITHVYTRANATTT